LGSHDKRRKLFPESQPDLVDRWLASLRRLVWYHDFRMPREGFLADDAIPSTPRRPVGQVVSRIGSVENINMDNIRLASPR